MPRNDVTKVHCLRISKTGSTTLKTYVSDNNVRRELNKTKLILHNHWTLLPEVLQNPNDLAVFFLREPLARFVSGFNSRVIDAPNARKAQRRNKEGQALEHFTTPNDLAEALSSSNEQTQDNAYAAMTTLLHARLHYTDWLVDLDYVKSRVHRLLFVGFLETFSDDVPRLFQLLGLERPIELPHQRQASDTASRTLSDEAQRNLRKWYADDIAIFDWAWSERERWAAPPAAEVAEPPTGPDAGDETGQPTTYAVPI